VAQVVATVAAAKSSSAAADVHRDPCRDDTLADRASGKITKTATLGRPEPRRDVVSAIALLLGRSTTEYLVSDNRPAPTQIGVDNDGPIPT
jgi:hypothetical protein